MSEDRTDEAAQVFCHGCKEWKPRVGNDDRANPDSDPEDGADPNLVRRLIAALRASQQREAVLTAKVASERRMYDIAKARADAAEQALADSVEGFAPGWCCPKDYCGVRFVGDEPCPEGW